MGVYVNRTCVYCSIKRPAYYMKQVTKEEISGRSGVSASFSPFAGKGKLAKSIRVHSGRTYRSNRKIWICKVEEACHNPNYFIELEKAQKKEREYLAYEDFLRDRVPTYIAESKWLDKYDPSASYADKFKKIKSTLKPLIDKWVLYKDKNKVHSSVKSIDRKSYRILNINFDQFYKEFSSKLIIDKVNIKSTYNNKSLKDGLFSISPFIQNSSYVVMYPLFATLFAYFFPSLLIWFGSSNSTFTTYHNTFHIIFIVTLFIVSTLAARSESKIIKPAQLEFTKEKTIAAKVEKDFLELEKNLADSHFKFYRNCVLYYLNSPISLKEYQTLPDGKEKNEHRTRFTYSLIPELSQNFDKINKYYVEFCAYMNNTTKPKKSKTTKNTESPVSTKKSTKKKTIKSTKKWTKGDYVRAYNEELYDEMVTLILCFNVAKADGDTSAAEDKFLYELPEQKTVLKLMQSYPEGSYKVKTFCQLLKKKLDESELENVINNLFFIAEAGGDITSDEVGLIEEYAGFMGIDKTKFNLIKDAKLEAHSDNKRASIMADDPIIDGDFADIDFDD
tara:strand:+ start:1470 stop:3149 length:1680 start_codon:yes stop_codon:yes gene_type:complete